MKFFFKKSKISIVIIGILIILFSNFFQKGVKNFFYLISEPVQKWLWSIGRSTSDFFEAISEMKNLKKEQEVLKLKIQELAVENTYLKELKKENEILREALNLGLEKEFTLKMAQVIGKEISEDILIIDKGEKDGIEIGSPIILQQKVLVGRIGEVLDNFSKVYLISLKENSFDIEIPEKDIFGLARGGGNFKLSLDLIPRETETQVGDQIFTSVLGGKFPKGLLVGEIQKIKKSDISPFQKIEVKPAFELRDLEFLFVITNFKQW